MNDTPLSSVSGRSGSCRQLSVCSRDSTSFLTQMELEMKRIESAIAEVNTQECLVKKELDVIKQLYRGELEHIDSVSLEQTV